MDGIISIPKRTLERLPVYYRVLVQCLNEGMEYISSGELGERAGFDNAQVRKDLNHIWSGGRPGLGYEIVKLAECLADFLGLNNTTDAVIVGAGRLGTALAGYPGFGGYGSNIVAVFDSDPDKIGGSIGDIPILPVAKLPDLIRRLGIRLGIITVPGESAQELTDAMVAAGILAIWNFAPVRLQVPEGVLVRNEDLAASLATLSYYVRRYSSAKEEGQALDGAAVKGS